MIRIWNKFQAVFPIFLLLVIFVSESQAQLEFSYTGIQTSFQKKILSDIPIETDAYQLTWNFYNSKIYAGELGIGAGNVRIPSQNDSWSDLSSKGLFSTHFIYTRFIRFVYFSSGIHFQKITGDVESTIPDENSISGFDKFIQHNTYYFYEFPVSTGLALSLERFSVRTGVIHSYYFGRQNYTQYLYQGLGNVAVNADQRTFSDKDNDYFFEAEFAYNFAKKYQIKLYYSVPIDQNDPAAGFSQSDQQTIRFFIGSIFN
ncbi:MAG: hypothetical protein HQ510_05700 [Candidatus Marinimicrobia bacterium]|nr:hypothetical protein [Candidatus Neomarinimicrobiota bacterium]